MTKFGAVPCPPYTFHSSRAKYPGNIQFDIKPDLTIELQNLYMKGNGGRGELLHREYMIFLMKH